TNHLVFGISPSRTLSHRRNQCRLAACSLQKPAGSSFAHCHSASDSAALLIWACRLNSSGGGKVRVSVSTLVMCSPDPDSTIWNSFVIRHWEFVIDYGTPDSGESGYSRASVNVRSI